MKFRKLLFGLKSCIVVDNILILESILVNFVNTLIFVTYKCFILCFKEEGFYHLNVEWLSKHKSSLKYILVSFYLTYSFAAVREDRTPGGKHRHKRRRVEEFNISSDGTIPCGPSAQTDSLLEGLMSATPDRIPKAEG